MDALWVDVRAALRGLTRRPSNVLMGALTLALGIGCSVAIYAVARPVLLKPTPFPDAERIVVFGEREADGSPSRIGWLTARDIERASLTLTSVSALAHWSTSITGDGAPERLRGESVTHGYFAALGLPPALGRFFTVAEDQPGANQVVVLSHALWVRRFGSDPGIVGQTVLMDERPYEVVGVLPAAFVSPADPLAEIWRPLGYQETDGSACRDCRHLEGLARLAPEVTLGEARAELDAIGAILHETYPTLYSGPDMALQPLPERLTATLSPVFRALFLGVALVLGLTCVNVTHLLVARALRREDELNVRAALGAGRGRLLRLLLVEGVLLAVAGGILALVLATWGLETVKALAPAGLQRLADARMEGSVLVATGVLTLLCGLLVPVGPAWLVLRGGLGAPAQGLRTVGGARHRGRGALIAVEVALAVTLLASTGLLLRSLGRLLSEDVGFQPRHVLALDLQTIGPRYAEQEAVQSFQREVLERVANLPGVEAVAFTSLLPFGANYDAWGVHRVDRPDDNPADAPAALRYSVRGDYLGALGLTLERGRPLSSADDADADPVVLINTTMADRIFVGEDPIGKQIRLGGPSSPARTIVGVVADTRQRALDVPPQFQVYGPADQWLFIDSYVSMVVRTAQDPETALAAVRNAVWSVDGRVPLSNAAPLPDLIEATTARRRFTVWLFGAFALTALLLAASGLYGVLSAMVAERTREIGIRGALGASRSGILGLIVAQSLRYALVGLALGLVLSRASSGLLASLLYGISPFDPGTIAAVAALLFSVAVLAAAVPAVRASRIHPAEALRSS